MKFILSLCAISVLSFTYPMEAMMKMNPLFEQRHSGRAYDASKPVTQEHIQLLAEAAQAALSCYNDQPWSFIFCDKTTQPQNYAKALSCLVEGNQAWAKNAPLLIIVVGDTEFRRMQKPNRWGAYDTGAAAISLALQATSMQLMAHQMGGFDEVKTKKLFQIPDRFVPLSVIAVGFEADAEAAKQVAKTRRPLQDNFFVGEWGNSLK
jgi:nitroreductase